ncbi:histidine phosphatase family protein [Populibacterium corticicola]|uniref:Histidine phosphatase family protein n=1 Tax=Populibacterium corticicola TaxID=1812826 RepID=A0ABW5XDL0_9MICO
MRTLYVVTHPEATHHVEGRVGGWYGSELTPKGLKAADQVGAALAARIPRSESIELFSSDLRRTTQTAAAISTHLGIEPVFDPRLREKSYGVAEGKPQAWLDERFRTPPPVGKRLRHDEGIDGAETMHVFATRIYESMEEILERQCSHQIISTHGGVLTFAAAAFLRLPIDALGHMRLRARPGTITVLREDDYFHNRSLIELGTIPQ